MTKQEQEQLFFQWFAKIEQYKDNYNLRMAWDAGFAEAVKALEEAGQ